MRTLEQWEGMRHRSRLPGARPRAFRDLDDFDYSGVTNCFARMVSGFGRLESSEDVSRFARAMSFAAQSSGLCHVVNQHTHRFALTPERDDESVHTVYRVDDSAPLPATITAPLGVWSLEAH